jgi:hypothetical protein
MLIAKPGSSRHWPLYDNRYANGVYGEAKEIDEWYGEDYEGTSVLAGAKVLKNRGLISEYRWCFSMEDVLRTISYHGPVVLGINWYEGMFTPDLSGYIRPTGGYAGGHCLLARGVNVRKERVLLKNSWGRSWGRWGGCYISFDDLGQLLSESGEACVPTKTR